MGYEFFVGQFHLAFWDTSIFVTAENDCIKVFENKLKAEKILDDKKIAAIWEKYQEESLKALEQARGEPIPTAESIWEYVFKDKNDPASNWRNF
jgi:TPP-dependent pyruvate/acetoin dehydrogenase alpha subunit